MIDTDGFFSRRLAREHAKLRKSARDKLNPPDRYVLIETSPGHWISKKVGSLYELI